MILLPSVTYLMVLEVSSFVVQLSLPRFQTNIEDRAWCLVGVEETSGFSDLSKRVLQFPTLGYLVSLLWLN